MLLDGDIVRTANGRAEIVFGDGTLLHLDHDTELEMLVAGRACASSSGRVIVRVSAAAAAAVRRSTRRRRPSGSSARGEYGITSSGRLDGSRSPSRAASAEIDDAHRGAGARRRDG